MALPGFNSVVGSEFGEVDRPSRGGYTEAGWNKGAWGDNLEGFDNQGFALPPSALKPYGYGSKNFASNFNQNYEIQVYSPTTGKIVTGPLKDLGPGAGTGAGLDMLGGSRSALGLEQNFKGGVQYRIVPRGTSVPEGTQLASATSDTSATAPDAQTQAAATVPDAQTQALQAQLAAAMASTSQPPAQAPSAATPAQAPVQNSMSLLSYGMSPQILAAILQAKRSQQRQAIQGALSTGPSLANAVNQFRTQNALQNQVPNWPATQLDPFAPGAALGYTT
jgi:hypothetical protein